MDQSRRDRVAGIVTFSSFAVVVAVVTFAVLSGWTIALVPGLAYVIAMLAAYVAYRLSRRRTVATGYAAAASQVFQHADSQTFTPSPALSEAAVATFRVTDIVGVCPLGYDVGTVISVDPSGVVQPRLCAPAETVLRFAANGEEDEVNEWCCPIYDHFLVFRREIESGQDSEYAYSRAR